MTAMVMPWMVEQITAPRVIRVKVTDANASILRVMQTIYGMGFIDVPTAAEACGLSVSMTRTYLSGGYDLGYCERRKKPDGTHLYRALNICNPTAMPLPEAQIKASKRSSARRDAPVASSLSGAAYAVLSRGRGSECDE